MGIEETQEINYKSGFVALMGRPNVGKSSLINALLQHTIAAVSPRPQTTRKRQMGILSLDDAQIIFEDTPGLHDPQHKLGEMMNQEALEALQEADVILLMVDASSPPNKDDMQLAEAIRQAHLSASTPVFMAINKIDLVDSESLENNQQAYQQLLPESLLLTISVQEGRNLDELVRTIVEHLPENPPFFPNEPLTDLYEREIAADLIRAAALVHLRDEVPHGIAVRIDEYTERNEQGAYIAATLFVERDSQKGIVIGRGGSMLKQIGITAREQIEEMSGRKVFLRLRVKVRKNWRNDPAALKLFGFSGAK